MDWWSELGYVEAVLWSLLFGLCCLMMASQAGCWGSLYLRQLFAAMAKSKIDVMSTAQLRLLTCAASEVACRNLKL